jgi:hypothetical protein
MLEGRMGTVHEIHDAWKTAKGIGLSFVMALAGGWLTRELLGGKIDPANRAAAYILDLTLLAMLVVLVLVGARRWRRGQLTPAAKRLLVLSGVFLIVFFVIGWRSDLSLN